MVDIIIRNSDESEEIKIKTDLQAVDYGTKFTCMNVDGSITDVANPFTVGSVITLEAIQTFLAVNTSASITAYAVNGNEEAVTLEAATAKVLEAAIIPIVNESTYRNCMGVKYFRENPYEDNKDLLPWIRIQFKKNIKTQSATVKIYHDDTACTFAGNSSSFGTVSTTTLTMDDAEVAIFDCDTDLGVSDATGTWKLEVTCGTHTVTRSVKI